MELTSSYELRELTVKWTRTHAGQPTQDAAMCTFHLCNFTSAVPDASWTNADYAAVEALFDTWWTGQKAWYLPATALAEYNWRADGPAFKPFGSSLSPTLRITPRSVAGSSTTQPELPPQVATSVTEVVPSTFVAHDVEGVGDQTRNRWGRFYLPAPAGNSIVDGRWSSAYAEDTASRVQTLYNGLTSADFAPVVYSPTTGHAWTVTDVHVDDITDVIRRRRFVTPLSRHAKSITQVD